MPAPKTPTNPCFTSWWNDNGIKPNGSIFTPALCEVFKELAEMSWDNGYSVGRASGFDAGFLQGRLG